jgi:hypothetical protein
MNRARLMTLLLPALLLLVGCKNTNQGRPLRDPPPPDLVPTTIDYTDSDGFDGLFEAALVNQDPAILIRTGYQKPDWGPRLNAWIAAWNMGGKVQASRPTVRMQAPVLPSVTVDGDSIREFRLLIESLMNHVEDIASRQSAWWAEERTRSRRVALLKPYNLRFLMADDGTIQLLFFNGNYSQYYAGFLREMAVAGDGDALEWSRTYRCARCKGPLARRDAPAPAPLMRGAGEGR